jgi:ABC-2 type transport system permease protein
VKPARPPEGRIRDGAERQGGHVTAAFAIARDEWRRLRRERAAVLALALVLLLWAMAAFTAWDRQQDIQADRSRRQAQADHEFESQPDRHPHRMVHYGQFVFRPIQPLAAFDPGVEAYTGHTLFLEGHRQNSANFEDVRQSSLLLRFGALTPATVLQVLVPLLLIFLGHAAIARERESGTLRLMLAQGVPVRQVVLGKLLGIGGVAAVVLVPPLAGLAAVALAGAVPAGVAAMLAAGYLLWVLAWAAGIAAVSAWCRRAQTALAALLVAWTASVVALPRLAAEAASARLPLPTRFETDIAIARDLAEIGDSHDADDPYFQDFRRQVLARYGVARIEDLPVNYKGLLGMEGERLSARLFEQYARASFDRQQAQLAQVDRWAVLSPVIALQRLSTALSGTDLHEHRRFTEAAERHRYRFVQQLNQLQAEKLSYAGDRSSRDSRIGHEHWRDITDFHHEPEPAHDAVRRALPAAGVLVAWALTALALLGWASRRLARSAS